MDGMLLLRETEVRFDEREDKRAKSFHLSLIGLFYINKNFTNRTRGEFNYRKKSS